MNKKIFKNPIKPYNFNMKLKVNSVISAGYKEGLTIQGLLDLKKIEAVPWLVISVNGIFVKREKFKEHVLNDEDVIEMIYVRGGG